MYGKFLRGIALALSLTVGGVAHAQSFAASPIMAVADRACLSADVDGNCLLRFENWALELGVQSSGEISLVFHGADAAKSRVISVQQDLLTSTTAGVVSPDDAMAILNELAHSDGAIYMVPDFSQLSRDLGFPEGHELTVADFPDLLRAHVQRILGVDARTASYIASRVEIQTNSAKP